jgi:hypothetical protein
MQNRVLVTAHGSHGGDTNPSPKCVVVDLERNTDPRGKGEATPKTTVCVKAFTIVNVHGQLARNLGSERQLMPLSRLSLTKLDKW